MDNNEISLKSHWFGNHLRILMMRKGKAIVIIVPFHQTLRTKKTTKLQLTYTENLKVETQSRIHFIHFPKSCNLSTWQHLIEHSQLTLWENECYGLEDSKKMVLDLNLVLLKTLYDCIAANEYLSFSNLLEFLDLDFLEIFDVSLVFFHVHNLLPFVLF